MLRRLLVLAIALGCRTSPRYEPPEWTQRLFTEMRFVSAELAGPSTAVYSLIEGRYRHVDDQPLWASGRREYVVAIHVLGVLDLSTGEHRVVVEDVKERVGDGNGRFEVVDARGGYALVERGRETEGDVLVDPGGWFLLDLERAALLSIDPPEDLRAFDVELAGEPRLVDGEGTVLYEARARHALMRLARPSRWIARARGGERIDLGAGRLLGEAGGVVYLERAHGGLAFDPATRAVREVDDARLAGLVGELETRRFPAELAVTAEGSALAWREPSAGERTIAVASVAR